jgi:hypothetical protein
MGFALVRQGKPPKNKSPKILEQAALAVLPQGGMLCFPVQAGGFYVFYCKLDESL